MRRREFIVIAGSAWSWPLIAHGRNAEPPTIGFLSLAAPEAFAHLLSAYREGLKEAGFVEGENIAIEYRWARGQYEMLPALAADLVAREVALIVSSGGDRPSLAARSATSQIPIVFLGSDDPVGLGLVETLGRPGGNMTGASLFTSELEVKKLELLTEALPGARRLAMLVNPINPAAKADVEKVEAAAQQRGVELQLLPASDVEAIEAAFSSLERKQVDGILVGHDPFFNSRREQIVAHVTKLTLPAIFEHREFIEAGGLMSYGNDIAENYRIGGLYTGRILKGAKPADLPVQQARKFEFIVNLRAARALNLEFPSSILVRADEVIE